MKKIRQNQKFPLIYMHTQLNMRVPKTFKQIFLLWHALLYTHQILTILLVKMLLTLFLTWLHSCFCQSHCCIHFPIIPDDRFVDKETGFKYHLNCTSKCVYHVYMHLWKHFSTQLLRLGPAMPVMISLTLLTYIKCNKIDLKSAGWCCGIISSQ